MDDAPLRRGQTTVHEKWDVNRGILSGDAMLIMAYQLFENYEPNTFQDLAKLFSKTALEVCEGQQYDVDFETRLIDITKTWWRGKITSTKSSKGRRVDMSQQLAEVLRDLKQNQWKKYAGKNVPQWVFAGPNGNVLCLPVLRKTLNQCLEAAGLRHIRIHDLRHTYATIRLLKGHNIGDVSYQLGHSDISTTYNVYTHWIPGKFKSEVDELDTQPNATYAQPEKRISLEN